MCVRTSRVQKTGLRGGKKSHYNYDTQNPLSLQRIKKTTQETPISYQLQRVITVGRNQLAFLLEKLRNAEAARQLKKNQKRRKKSFLNLTFVFRCLCVVYKWKEKKVDCRESGRVELLESTLRFTNACISIKVARDAQCHEQVTHFHESQHTMTSELSGEGGFELRGVVKPLALFCRHLVLLAVVTRRALLRSIEVSITIPGICPDGEIVVYRLAPRPQYHHCAEPLVFVSQ